MNPLRSMFIMLSAIGFYLLWIAMAQNGTLLALDQVTESGVYSSGRSLKTTYLGIPLLDGPISTLVGFTDALTNGAELTPWLLMIEVVSTLQTVALLGIAESLRGGVSLFGLVLSSMWPLLCNGFGAGVVLPIYFFVKSGSRPWTKTDRLPVNHSKALIPTAVVSLFIPTIIVLAPPLVHRGPELHQTLTALFQITPLLAAVVQSMLAPLFCRTCGSASRTDNYLSQAYLFAGMFSAIGHFCAVLASVFSSDPSTSLGRTFVPWPADVVPDTARTVYEGALLFLKYDWAIINVSSTLWLYLAMKPYLNIKTILDTWSTVFLIALSMLVVGPGACLSWGLWLREGWIR